MNQNERKAFVRHGKELAELASRSDLRAMTQKIKSMPEIVTYAKALLDACLHGQPKAVKLLLDNGADPNLEMRAEGVHRPLHRTIARYKGIPWRAGHLDVLTVLLDHGADMYGRAGFGLDTAVGTAAVSGNHEALSFLLDAGADLDVHDAAATGDTNRLDQLIQQDPDTVTRRSPAEVGTSEIGGGFLPLQSCARSRLGLASKEKDRDLVQTAELLIKCGAPLGKDEIDGVTVLSPVGCAIEAENWRVLDVLLSHDAPVTEDAFFAALWLQNVDVLDRVWDRRRNEINVDQGSLSDNRPVLSTMLRLNRPSAAAWLLEHGANPNLSDANGWTALHFAARRGVNTDLIRLLLKSGANVTINNNEGETPLDIARSKRRRKIVELLDG